MVHGGPSVNRLYPVTASVLFTRQLLSMIFLLIFNLLTKKIDLSVVTKKDWKFMVLCGKQSSHINLSRNIWDMHPLVLFGPLFPEYDKKCWPFPSLHMAGKRVI